MKEKDSVNSVKHLFVYTIWKEKEFSLKGSVIDQ